MVESCKHDLQTNEKISPGDEFCNKKYLVIDSLEKSGQGSLFLVEEKQTQIKYAKLIINFNLSF